MHRRASRSWAKAHIVLLFGGSVGLLGGCASEASAPPAPIAEVAEGDLPIIQLIEGVFDGTEITYRVIQPAGGDEGDLGVITEPLIDIPSQSCTTTTCVGTASVAFSNVAGGRGDVLNGTPSGTWPAACGALPTGGSSGVCQQVRLRNLFPNQVERAYAEMVSLTPTGDTTAVSIPRTAHTADPDFGLAPPPVANGLWRLGELGRGSRTVANSVSTRLVFHGTTTGAAFTFSFMIQVRGLIVPPTMRANVGTGLVDAPGAGPYAALGTVATTSSAGVALAGDGQFAAFTTAGTVHRKNLVTGELVSFASGCSSASQPDLSNDGAVVAYQGAGCPGAVGSQVFVHTFGAGSPTLVSHNGAGAAANSASTIPRLNYDGSVVVFASRASNIGGLPVPAGRTCYDVYRSEFGEIHLASANRDADYFNPLGTDWAPCGPAALDTRYVDVSDDGDRVAFLAQAALDPFGDTNATADVYIYEHTRTSAEGLAVVYPVTLGVPAASMPPSSPGISGDGSWVVYRTNAGARVFRSPAFEGNTAFEEVTVNPSGAPVGGTAQQGAPVLSTSGRFVAFTSPSTTLAPAQGAAFANTGTQVYVCDMEAPVDPDPANDLRRCWVASTLQPSPDSVFQPLPSGTSIQAVGLRPGFAYPDNESAGFVAYYADPAGSAWAPADGPNVFVSPVGDPRPQQPVNAR